MKRPETVPRGTDPEIQAQIHAVTHALRYSTLYAQHLNQRIGPTPYLDDLHDAVIRLIEELERNGYQPTHKVHTQAATSGRGITEPPQAFTTHPLIRLT